MPSLKKPLVRRAIAAALSAGILCSAGVMARPALAKDQVFFNSVAGMWRGPGEIVAGKYKGTRFTCALAGNPATGAQAGITMDGTCRVGVFSQKMSATIRQFGQTYTGKFLDGADGKGLDIVSGNVTDEKVVMGINRKQLNGAMVASLIDPNTMNVTISVKVGERMIPVIGVTLARDADQTRVGSIGR